MRQPHHLALYWVPSGRGSGNPVAMIMARAYGTSENGEILFGGECATKREIDELIGEMIQDLEDAGKLAHERFEH